MDQEKFNPLNIYEVALVKSPSPPDDLKGLVTRLFEVQRFVDDKYPPGIFFDNVGEHEFRLAIMVDAAKIENVDNTVLKRTVWVHDIPELVIGEYISPRKQDDRQLATSLEIEEQEAAVNLLRPEDAALIKAFNDSGKFLKGEGTFEGVTKEGLVASVLDKIDGNMFFHHSLARWVKEGNGDREIPSRTAMEYTFKQRTLFFRNLDKLPSEYGEVAGVCKRLLDYEIEFIVGSWSSVPEGKQPQMIKDQLKAYIV